MLRLLGCMLIFAVVFGASARADDEMAQAKTLFERYVALGAAFDAGVADLYSDSAHIKNTRRYSDGQSRSMSMPALTYKALIRQVMPQAKAAGDSSSFSQVTYAQEGERVRISATRYSELKKYSSPFSLLVGPGPDGSWLIFEELSESTP